MNDMNLFITPLVKISPLSFCLLIYIYLLIYSWQLVYALLGIKVYEVVKVGWPSSLIADGMKLKGFAVSYRNKQDQTVSKM